MTIIRKQPGELCMKLFALRLLTLGLLLNSLTAAIAGTLYQVSTGNALMEGLFQGAENFKELKKHGDFGLGSVEHMDGELIAIDGNFYRIDPEGKMHIIPDTETTPYAIVTHFKPEITFTLKNVKSFSDLVEQLNQHLPNRHIPYAIHLKGKYKKLELRAVRRQTPPYPDFPKVVSEQAIFHLNDVSGDGVGFFTPAYLAKLNVPGYHIHFITEDRKIGGHILSGEFDSLEVSLMPLNTITVTLPKTDAFKSAKELDTDFRPMLKKNFGPGVQLK